MKVLERTKSILDEMNVPELLADADVFTLDQLAPRILAHDRGEYFCHRFFSEYPDGEKITRELKNCSSPRRLGILFNSLARAVFWIPDGNSLVFVARLCEVYNGRHLDGILSYLGEVAVFPGNPQFSSYLQFFLANPDLVNDKSYKL